MRVGFAGTPAFAARALAAIAEAGFTIPLVLTQPDRPQGRGLKRRGVAGQGAGAARGDCRCCSRATLRTTEAPRGVLAVPARRAGRRRLRPDPAAGVLAWPRHGCLNIHASLLPRWRGAAPIQRALLAGDARPA